MKRGTASDVANLIAMIVLFMVLYIVILPTPERENLVNNVDSTGSSDYNQDSGSRDSFKVLLSESPGFVYPYIRDVLAQPLPSINLFANQETKEIQSLQREACFSILQKKFTLIWKMLSLWKMQNFTSLLVMVQES